MLPAIVIEKPPRLIRAIRLIPGNANADEAAGRVDDQAETVTHQHGPLGPTAASRHVQLARC